jgi:AcrR family transcriptional regulator
VLDIAASMFAARGYAGTSIRSITTSVGMLPGSIYYHFQSKEDLLFAVYREGVARFETAIDAALAGASGEPWQARAFAALCASLQGVLLRPWWRAPATVGRALRARRGGEGSAGSPRTPSAAAARRWRCAAGPCHAGR